MSNIGKPEPETQNRVIDLCHDLNPGMMQEPHTGSIRFV